MRVGEQIGEVLNAHMNLTREQRRQRILQAMTE